MAAAVGEGEPGGVVVDGEGGGAGRADQGDVVLALHRLPQLLLHQAGFDDPGELAQAAVVGRKSSRPPASPWISMSWTGAMRAGSRCCQMPMPSRNSTLAGLMA